MARGIATRLRYTQALIRQKAFSKWIAIASLLYTCFTIWRDEFASHDMQERLRAVTYLPDWPVSWWAAICLGALLIWVFESSHRMHRALIDRYAHALALVEMIYSLDIGNMANRWELRLQLRNTIDLPLKLSVEYEIFECHGLKLISPEMPPAIIPRNEMRVLFPGCGFSAAEYNSLPDEVSGVLEYSILYGHPDLPLSRRAKKS